MQTKLNKYPISLDKMLRDHQPPALSLGGGRQFWKKHTLPLQKGGQAGQRSFVVSSLFYVRIYIISLKGNQWGML